MTAKVRAKTLTLDAIARAVRFQHHPTLTACWIWTGATSNGKPIACVGGEQEPAARAVFRRFRGCTPNGNLRMQCRNQLCVNPSHTGRLM